MAYTLDYAPGYAAILDRRLAQLQEAQARLVAYDKKDGHELGSVVMPAAISGSPMTYSMDGRQYIIVAVSGGNYTGEYIAYALPQSELPRSGN